MVSKGADEEDVDVVHPRRRDGVGEKEEESAAADATPPTNKAKRK